MMNVMEGLLNEWRKKVTKKKTKYVLIVLFNAPKKQKNIVKRVLFIDEHIWSDRDRDGKFNFNHNEVNTIF